MSEENREAGLQPERETRRRRSDRWNGNPDAPREASAFPAEQVDEPAAEEWPREESGGLKTDRIPEADRKPAPGGKGKRIWVLPLLYALPFAAAGLFAVLRWGPEIRDVIQVIIKLAVRG